MVRRRRSYSTKFKAKVALAAARGDRTLSQLSSQYGVHANQISTWKRQLLEGASSLFEDGRRRKKEEDSMREGALYEEIGRLKVELDWLKKKGSPAEFVGNFEAEGVYR